MAKILKESSSKLHNQLDKMEEDIQFESLILKRSQVKLALLSSKDQAHFATRQIPVQLLALEWLNKIDASIETRAYLVENFLPILVLGCEKVLKEAQLRSLLQENKKDVNFNPINHLAQFLMRNNPKYNNSNETSAYVRTMREVYHELREQMFAFQENKLAKVKADVRKRRSEREKIEKSKEVELERRRLKLEDLFSNFHVESSGRIEIAIVLETIRIYNDHILKMPDQTKSSVQLKSNAWPSFCFDRNDLNLSKRLLKHEYSQVMNAFTENLKSEYFDLFVEFIEQCAVYYVELANRTTLNRLLFRLFQLMDTTKTGFLIRRRLVGLFDSFEKNDSTGSKSNELRSPLDWPLLDPFIKFENKLEVTRPGSDFSNKNESNVDTSIELPVEPAAVSEPPAQLDTTPNENEIMNKTEDTSHTEESSSILQDADKTAGDGASISDQQNADQSSISTKPDQIKATESKDKSNNSNENIFLPVKVKLERKNELEFLKGGNFYFKPMEGQLHSFDTGLLKLNPYYSVVTYDDLSDFNTEFVNAKQFLNMINNFIKPSFFYSEILVNDLIVFVKDNYSENLAEKNSKLEKIANENKQKAQTEKYSACFDRLDNESSGFVDLDHLTQLFESYKDGLFKDFVQKAKSDIQSDIMLNNGDLDSKISKDEFAKFMNSLIVAADLPKFQDQIMNLCMNSVQSGYNDKARGETRQKWLEQMKNVGNITYGSLEPLYKHLFLVLLKDSENHGNSKHISAYVSVLEKKDQEIVLKYHASTPQDSKYLLGKTLSRNTKNVSFKVIDTGKSLHIARTQSDPNVYFFNPDNKTNGSLVIYPLKYTRTRTFGLLGIDTIQEKNKKNFFNDHELSFYQGVAATFAKAYANIVFKNRLAKTIKSAIEWLSQRCKTVLYYNVYAVQLLDNETRLVPDEVVPESSSNPDNMKPTKINLKQIMKFSYDNDKLVDITQPDDSLETNLKTGSCAYQCALTSEATVETFNSRVSYCFPLRNEEHKTVFVVELTTNELIDNVQKCDPDFSQIETVIYVLHKCQEELLEENFLGIDRNKYELENQQEQDKFEILFEKQYLNFLISQLETQIDQKIESPNEELIKLVADLVSNKDFAADHIISKSLVARMSQLDPSLATPFKRTESRIKFSTPESLTELHLMYIVLGKENNIQRLLVDWCCLIKNMKLKSEKIRANP